MVLELGARLEEPKQDADKIKEIRKLGGELLDLKDQDGLIPLYRCSTTLPTPVRCSHYSALGPPQP
jgi:hypothetical protein